MNVEIEAKMRIGDRQRLRARLVELGAEPLGRVITTDTFFDTADHRLRDSDCGLRLRIERRPAEPGDRRAVLAYKGPRAPGPIKRREEIELAVEDISATTQLLERLGFQPQVRFEKDRQSWLLDGCHVELDRLPRLGEFIEIEGPAERAVEQVRRKLGLDDQPLVREPYVAMIDAWLKEHGGAERSLTLDHAGSD